ncbi:RNA pseudouridine synthase [Spirochaetia bacterium]|nr:RNA pseudouridine synthase [Spirochaetia bacterium]
MPQPPDKLSLRLIAAADDDGRRLDRILRKALPDLPLSHLHHLLRKGRVMVDGVPGEAAGRVRAGAVIQAPLAGTEKCRAPFPLTGFSPEVPQKRRLETRRSAPFSILWEGAGLLVLNKPAGLTVHGPESLETQVQAYLAPKLPPSLSFKPGPLHRLDKPTGGIIVFSTNLAGAQSFSALLRSRRIRKTYLALLDGVLDRDETWEDTLVRDREQGKSFTADAGDDDAKEARTRVYPLARTREFTLARLEIDTGRTHQIRAQAAAHSRPLAGDRKYGGRPQQGGFLLHAWTLELPELALPELPRRLEAPLPDNFRRRIRELFGELDLV